MLSAPIDDSRMVTVAGNVRPEVRGARDLGRVPESMAFPHISLLLQRSPEREAAARAYIDAIHDKSSPLFHHWLTADEITAHFGVAQEDLATVKSWLEAHGFTVNSYSPNLVMDVSGTAGAIRHAFGADMHTILVRGQQHIVNVTEPGVPEALRAVLVGPTTLHDFRGHSMARRRVPKKQRDLTYTDSQGNLWQALVPADVQTIYNLAPVYAQGLTGTGQRIVLIEDTNLYTNDDWYTFRKVLGLSRLYPQGTLTVTYPTGPSTCTNPGDTTDDGEAALDVEWSTAVAPNASIILAACKAVKNSYVNFGGFVALANMLTQSNPPKIVSISYGESEPANGASNNALISTLYQTAAMEGISVYVSAGDEGASSSDADANFASHGINVTGWGSTPYNISVGGTDFEDTYQGTNTQYWNFTNAANFGSAKSYIPEIPWNGSCASVLFYTYLGFGSASAACNSSIAVTDALTDTDGGSGGPSNCYSGTPMVSGVTGGSCAGVAKPSWQSGLVGNPADGVRDIPDVSLFAANGNWGHYYIACYSRLPTATYGGVACNETVSNWSGWGGTSISSPEMAAIQALINEKTGQAWGNANTQYYAIAKSQFGATGNPTCNSSATGGPSASCDFYDVTAGDNDQACTQLVSGSSRKGYTLGGTYNCFGGSATLSNSNKTVTYTYGALSLTNASLGIAYGTNVGWDFGAGIGTVNAYALINDPVW
jgi:subtilase family serine protease